VVLFLPPRFIPGPRHLQLYLLLAHASLHFQLPL
jgi:hypothetical protein